MDEPGPAAWMIGHSNHTVASLLKLLREHGVTAVADVRTSPYSAYTSQYNREQLRRLPEAVDIGYVFLGLDLVGRPAESGVHLTFDDWGYDLA